MTTKTKQLFNAVFNDTFEEGFLFGTLAKAGRLNSNILTKQKTKDDVALIEQTCDALNDMNFDGKSVLNIASALTVAARKLEKGQLPVSEDKVIETFKTQVETQNKKKIAKDNKNETTASYEADKTPVSAFVTHSTVSVYHL